MIAFPTALLVVLADLAMLAIAVGLVFPAHRRAGAWAAVGAGMAASFAGGAMLVQVGLIAGLAGAAGSGSSGAWIAGLAGLAALALPLLTTLAQAAGMLAGGLSVRLLVRRLSPKSDDTGGLKPR